MLQCRTVRLLACLIGFSALADHDSTRADPFRTRRHEAPPVPTDLYGDSLPPGAIARLGTTMLRQPYGTQSVVFSPDGKLLALWDGSNTIYLWDAATGRLHADLTSNDIQWLTCFVFTPDSKALAIGDRAGQLWIWKLTAGASPRLLGEHTSAVNALAISFDGKTLASVADQEEAAANDRGIHLWDLTTGKRLRILQGQQDEVYRLVFCGQGNQLAAIDDRRILRVWDTGTGKQLWQYKEEQGSLADLHASADGKTLAAIAALNFEHGGALRLWDAANGNLLPLPADTDQGVSALALSRDGMTLALRKKVSIIFFNLRSLKNIAQFDLPGTRVHSMAVSADGKKAAAATDGPLVRLWDVATGKEPFVRPGHDGAVGLVRFLPDGKTVLSVGREGTVHVWDAVTGKSLRAFPIAGDCPYEGGVDLSPDGKRLASVVHRQGGHFYDVATGKQTGGWKPWDFDYNRYLAFSPDGKTLAVVAGHSGQPMRSSVCLLDGVSGDLIADLGLHPGYPGFPVFSPDGHLTVALGTARSVVLHHWHVATHKKKAEWSLACGRILFDTGHLFAVTERDNHGSDGAITLCDPHLARPMRTLPLDPQSRFLVRSPDGRLIVQAYSSKLQMRDARTGKRLLVLTGDQGHITCGRFSADGRYLATGGTDGTVLIWDVAEALRQRPQPPGTLTRAELQACWEALGSMYAEDYVQAIDRLAEAPQQAVAYLTTKLRPVFGEGVVALIAELDAAGFAKRQKAMRELFLREYAAEAALRHALAREPTLELRQRVELLLKNLHEPVNVAELLRPWRAVMVLEQSGTPEARKLLETLAQGSPAARLTRDVQAVLERLGRKPGGEL